MSAAYILPAQAHSLRDTEQPKVTGWYRGDQKPVRVGVYERMYPNGLICCCWWNGKHFSFGYANPDLALAAHRLRSGYQSLPWRGITSKDGK